tara:strand:- start:20894 stop:21118 length:225 start_codon:yes stop_codon:yes gene_type:complete
VSSNAFYAQFTRWPVGLTFLILALTLVAGYSILRANYFIRRMDNIHTLQIEKAAQNYLTGSPTSERRQPETPLD